MNILTTLLVLLVLVCQTSHAVESGTEAIIITAKPRFKTEDHFRDLIVSDGKQSYEIGWAVASFLRETVYFYPVSLRTQKIYTFTIIEQSVSKAKKTIRIPSLIRIEAEGRVIYDAEICEVHKAKMEQKELQIVYGLILPDQGEPSARTERREFPHRYEVSFGGCVVSPDSPETKTLYVCGECKKAYQTWKSKHQKSKR